MHNTDTVFPDNIDSRSLFSDLSVAHTNLIDGYNELIRNKSYKSASQYLYDNIEVPNLDVDYDGAYLWNRFDKRIATIENYVISESDNPNRNYYQDSEPTDKHQNMIWIG